MQHKNNFKQFLPKKSKKLLNISWVFFLTVLVFSLPLTAEDDSFIYHENKVLAVIDNIPSRGEMEIISKHSQQSKKDIRGKITDVNGESIIGANIIEQGTTNGTISDYNGDFALNVSSDSRIIITYIGYVSQEIVIDDRNTYNIVLEEEATYLESVVVTAFATQKKINLTGAISTVSSKEIAATPISNISSALIGQSPGVGGLQASGEAGRSSTDIRIRGISTYGSAVPLIVIDGVEQPAEQAFEELDAMDSSEILGVSILKDASSTAVYGIRGANGVIVITTKRGHVGKPVITFSANTALTKASMMQKGLSSYDWAYMRDEAILHDQNSYVGTAGLSEFVYGDYHLNKFKINRDFTPEEVDAMDHLTEDQKNQLKASPALYYGSHDHYKQLFGDYGPQAQINLNVSGGIERVKYFLSFGFFDQQSILQRIQYYGADTKSAFQRYNFRTNFDIDVTKNLTVSLNLAGQFGETHGPGSKSDPYDLNTRYQDMMHLTMESNPIQNLDFIDGKLIGGLSGLQNTIQNPISRITADMKGGATATSHFLGNGRGVINNSLLDNTLKFNYKMPFITKGLSLQGTLNYQDNHNKYITIGGGYPSYGVQRDLENPNIIQFMGGGKGANWFSMSNYSNWNKLYVDAGVSYINSFNNHNIAALLLGKASKYTMPLDSYNTPSGIMGLVGRLMYNFDDRYMAEFNMGYNGTEQFAEGKRFGFFPAFSVGWIPTLEAFYPENDFLTFLKIRASYGEVGNDLLGSTGRRYLYLSSTYNVNQGGYYLGTSDGSTPNPHYPGANEGAIGNPNITWEKAQKSDIGFEAAFFNDRLMIDYDWFFEKRGDILTTLGIIPGVYGVPSSRVPPANVGKTENQGYEIVVGWDDRIDQVAYSIEGHVSYAKNKVIYKAEAPNPYDWMNETGKSIGQRFGLISDGLFDTNEELSNRPYNTFTSNRATLGDIKYMDLNGDGLIDNKDIAPIGYPNYPRYHFGFKLGLDYKRFELNLLFNGTKEGSHTIPVIMPYQLSGGNAWQWMYDGRWTPEKAARGEKITFPRPTYNYSGNDNNYLTSDYWVRSTDFFRLKNIQIAYSFSPMSSFMKTLGLSSLRLFVSGNNIYTFKNDLTEVGIDPESVDRGSKYVFPLISTYNVGLNVQF